MSILSKVFGTKNAREIKKLQPKVQRINEMRAEMEKKSDSELRGTTAKLKEKLDQGASLDDIVCDAFATVREAAWRTLKMRHFDVQLIGGMVLHSGRISEMRTGEGKTLTATLPVYLNALAGKGVHVVTVNDYLARRDAEWMGQIYGFLGMSTGVIVHGIEDWQRQKNYRCDITYGQNNEFGFDYLRDNMKMSPDRMVQRELNYALVDEVNSILIDEARTPLIISGPSDESADLYVTVNRMTPRLKRDIDYTVDEKAHSVMLTDAGVERVEKLLGLKNLYDPVNIAYNHHVAQALRAHTLYKRDVNYLIDEGKILIIDEFTGRKMPGRRWSDGLHQAIEAKEGVEIEEENQTLATVTFQNFFRMYKKLAGMTGTADTEAAEFHHIYKLDVVVIPTNKPMIRDDMPDLVYKNERGKFKAVVADILDCQSRGQPVLVGTTSVEKSEVVASLLKKEGVKFDVLNAKQHEREAGIVAQAGRRGAITISTNMAGRGTDIVLGGNAEYIAKQMMKAEGRESEPGMYERLFEDLKTKCDAEREEVLAAGGLKIIGTERHESRRIDNQLRGRAGRQGDPGGSRFYLSLEDDLLRIFGADRITGLMERLGMEEDVPIESGLVTRSIEGAQKKVEGHNFDSRKNLLEYDDVMNQQRKTVYALRRQILSGLYQPTLSEEDEKAGKEPLPAPMQSGDWTIEGMAGEMEEEAAAMVDAALEEQKQRLQQAEAPPDEDGGGPENEGPPVWRKLRAQVWRQTGAWLPEIETRFAGSREDLIAYIAREVAASLVQQRERIYDLADALIGALVNQHCPSNQHVDDWDMDALKEAVQDQFAVEFKPKKKVADAEEMADHIWKAVDKRLAERLEELSRPWLMYFSRHFYLEEIDHQWIDHLKTMDHLREGIYLRGYGQKDPKKEYKKEGFDLFAQMMQTIQVNTGRKLFRVQIQRPDAELPAMQAKQRKMVMTHAAAATSGAASEGQAAAEPAGSSAYGKAADGGEVQKVKTVRRDQPKVGRNDPCPCGSGKKYKKCHGREDSAEAVYPVAADGDELAELRRKFPSVDTTGFTGHLASCRQAGALAENTADLFIAWAAARGDGWALRQVDGLIAAIAPALRGIDRSPVFVDEVSQAVRVRLLVAEPGADPRIAAYRGRGPLGAWVRAAAMRVAIDLKRSAAPALAGDDLLGDLVSGEPDPAIRHLKTLHRADFQQALADALAALPDRQRAVLRLHHVDGLRLAEIGRLYGVHESTVSRWVTRAAEEVADQTRRRLTSRLSLSGSGVDSLARLVRSQLDLSIARILR